MITSGSGKRSVPQRGEVWLVELEPTVGSEIQKTRPCAVISPDSLNEYLETVIVAPLTSAQRSYPTRVNLVFGGRRGQVALDQIRTIDKQRLKKRLGRLTTITATAVYSVLVEMFEE